MAKASFLIAAAIALAGFGPAPIAPSTSGKIDPPTREELLRAGPLGERTLGNPNAPIVVIEYASLTCPHCRNFHANVFPQVKRQYIDTGKVLYIVREFPIGRSAGNAAIINRCAPPENYFSLLDAFLSRQSEWVSQEVRLDAIYGVAKSSGMSRETFDKCLSNQAIIDGLSEVKQRGRQFGVVGTPTFFVNGRKAQGAITFEEIKALIEP
ncbi:MAG TPA: DsbA family protein [Methyloceanibacter sp.]|nr:DsbA family protein [Methyloceanibacter sp.]